MFKISKEQDKTFASEADRALATRVVAFLGEHLPHLVAGCTEDELIERVLSDFPVARRYGVVTDAALTKWCYLSLVAGSNFHEAPDFHGFLRDPLMLPSAKMTYLMRSLAVALEKAQKGQP